MLSKCANPGCPAIFLYLHHGKLFRLDTSIETIVSVKTPESRKPSRRVEFFWLCQQCATEFTLGYNKEAGITVVPLPEPLTRAASAS